MTTRKMIGILLLLAAVASTVYFEVELYPKTPWTRSSVDNLALFRAFPGQVGGGLVLFAAGGALSGLFSRRR